MLRELRRLAQLEKALSDRAKEIASIRECMAGEHYGRTSAKPNTWDHWELDYIDTHKCEHPSYEAKSLDKYAARPWWST